MGRTAAYEWREADPGFAAMWDHALKIGKSALEDEAHRRGFEGVDEPLTHQGQFTYLRDFDAIDPETDKPYEVPPILMDENGNPRIATMKKYSDTLAIFLLKAHDPDKYRENSKLEVSGQLDLRKLSDDEIDAELAALSAVVKAADGPAAD